MTDIQKDLDIVLDDKKVAQSNGFTSNEKISNIKSSIF